MFLERIELEVVFNEVKCGEVLVFERKRGCGLPAKCKY